MDATLLARAARRTPLRNAPARLKPVCSDKADFRYGQVTNCATNPLTTKRYAHLADDPLRAAVERFGSKMDALGEARLGMGKSNSCNTLALIFG